MTCMKMEPQTLKTIRTFGLFKDFSQLERCFWMFELNRGKDAETAQIKRVGLAILLTQDQLKG